jgi:hypothetical protein
MMRRYNQGWRQESERHSLARRGVKTGRKSLFAKVPKFVESASHEFFEVHITSTGRSSMRDKPSIFNEETKKFRSLGEAKEFVKEQYGNKKGHKMYVDSAEGKPEEIGKIYGFWTQDVSHYDGDKWFQEDWVEIRKVKHTPTLHSSGRLPDTVVLRKKGDVKVLDSERERDSINMLKKKGYRVSWKESFNAGMSHQRKSENELADMGR